MQLRGIFILVASVKFVAPQTWTNLFDPGGKMKAFLEQQKARVEQVFYSGYENARKMTESVNNYVGEQQRKLSNDVNSYVENIKDNGRKAVDACSYVPSDDESAQMEYPDIELSVPATIGRHGYPCETHTVVSQGYVLSVHRIPRSKQGGEISKKTILLQHGIFASSIDWILNGPEKALAYVLADAGYDVWMTNIRGNKYSREHTSLKTNSKSYWNFSWHEVALHDVPAVIDYILKTKGSDTKITYIGYSMGTKILFAMLSLRPEYNKILKAGFAMAPVVFMADVKSPLKSLAPFISNFAYMEMLYGSHEFIPKSSILGRMTTSNNSSIHSKIGKNMLFYVCGHNEKQFNETLLPVFLTHLGTGTSWKTAVHFAQEVLSDGKFQQFDYGSSHNQTLYGKDKPPEYDLSKVTLPITLFYAENDLLSSEPDALRLFQALPERTTELYKVPCPEFNHLDYLWAVDAPTLLNEKVLDSLGKAFDS